MLYPLDIKIYVQLVVYYHFCEKGTIKAWLNLSLEASIFLNFMRVDMSFEACNKKVYSCKYA